MAATIQTTQTPKRARALDTSGNNNHGQIYSGRALEFDGVTDYLNCGTINLGKIHTFSCWAYFDDITLVNIVNHGNADYMLFVGSGSVMQYDVGSASAISSTDKLTANTWQHLVVTRSGTSVNWYINGVIDSGGGETLDSDDDMDGTMLIGAKNSTHHFNGKLANVQAWDAVWTQADVTYAYLNPEQLALNRGGTSLTSSNLKAWYPMQDGHRGQQSFILDGADVAPTSKNHATTVFYGDEEAVNGDMETFPTLHATKDDTFTDDSVDGSQNVDMVTEGTIKNGGSKSAKCTFDGATTGYVTYNKTDYVVGRSYRAEVYMRAGGSQTISAFQMFADDSIRGEDGTDGAAITPDEDFAIAYVEFVAAATTMMINMKFTGTDTHFAFIDDFSIKEIGTATGWTDADQQLSIPQTALQSYNQLAWFDGTADYVGIADNSALDVTNNLTVSCWAINSSSGLGSSETLVGKYKSAGVDERSWLFHLDSAEKLVLNTSDDGEDGLMTHTSDAVVPNIDGLNHYAFTFAGGTVKFYVNGAEIANTKSGETQTVIMADDADMAIGAISEAGGNYWSGMINEVAMWDTAVLTLAEVQAIFNDGKALDVSSDTGNYASSGDLVGYWRNNGLAVWEDLSTNSNDGTPTSLTETLLIPAGVDVSRDNQGFLMNRQKDTNALNLTETSDVAGNVDYVDTGDHFESVFQDSFTVSAWIKPNDGRPAVIGSIFNTTKAWTGYIYFQIDATTGKCSFQHGVTSDAENLATSSTFADNSSDWHNFVAVYTKVDSSNSTIDLYMDGDSAATQLAGTHTTANYDNDTLNVYIGARNLAGAADRGFNGQVDDVLLYDKALSAAEVTRNYNAGKRSHR